LVLCTPESLRKTTHQEKKDCGRAALQHDSTEYPSYTVYGNLKIMTAIKDHAISLSLSLSPRASFRPKKADILGGVASLNRGFVRLYYYMMVASCN